MANKGNGNGNVATLAGNLAAGITKRLASAGQLTLAGSTFTPAQVATQLQTVVQLQQAVDAARAATKAKVAAMAAQMPALRTIMSAFVQFLRASFGNQPDVLADFGLEPRKVATPLTVEQKATAAAKRAATRAKRNTMGAVQKKSVKGTVTGVTITPIDATEPVAPATATPTAPTAGAATGGGTPHTA
ncbi:MAG: hypothetical protein ABSE49_34935 [Polyangiaceae bacterium]|jgi:hypothetical protein